MADLANLRTASLYINNQLLSRGLLRDGRSIDFADPVDGETGSTAETMGRIISVVNDLILRRDRDAEHRESLSTALRTVRAESLRQANDLQRALDSHADAQRRAALADAAEASLRAQLAATEASVRKLRDEAARMKTLVAQTRATCANDVRKRDRQIDGLKKAVTEAGRARGERRSAAITTVVIGEGHDKAPSARQQLPKSSPAVAKIMAARENTPAASSPGRPAVAGDVHGGDELRSQTNAFLAELARGLSNDNETLLCLVQHTSQQLRAMSGFVARDEEMDTVGTSPDAMMLEMDAILDHLRTILTNPSFVPIEEVMQRETEIGRLRDGWEKMEGRWKEAVHLLDGWRRRMALSGRPVNMEEIKMGLRLSPVRVRNVAETAQGFRGMRAKRYSKSLRVAFADPEEDANHVAEEEEDQDVVDEEEADNNIFQDGVITADYNSYGDESLELEPEMEPEMEPLVRTPSPAESSLHLVPAPPCDDQFDGLESDSESSLFMEDGDNGDNGDNNFAGDGGAGGFEEPNVQIIEQSLVLPSLEASPAPVALPRATPSPPPPPKHQKQPERAEKREGGAVIRVLSEKPSKPMLKTAAVRNVEKLRAGALRPSSAAGNRGATTATKEAKETKETKETAGTGPGTGIARGKKVLSEEKEATKDLGKPAAKPAKPAAAAATKPASSAAGNKTPATTTGKLPHRPLLSAKKPAASTVTTATAPSKTAVSATVRSRPASAASQASDAPLSASSPESVSLVPSGPSAPSARHTEKKVVPASTKTAAPATAARPVSSLAARKVAATTASSKPVSRPTSPKKLVPHQHKKKTAAEDAVLDEVAGVKTVEQPETIKPEPSDSVHLASELSAEGVVPETQEQPSSTPEPTATDSMSDSTEPMPPPPVPTALSATSCSTVVTATTTTTSSSSSSATTTSAGRTRSRSPVKTTFHHHTTTTTGSPSKLPLPTTTTGAGAVPASPALNMATIAAKLAASEREADAARVRAKLKALRGMGRTASKTSTTTTTTASSSRSVSGSSGVSEGQDASEQKQASVAVSVAESAPAAGQDDFDPVKKMLAESAAKNLRDQQQQQQQTKDLPRKRQPQEKRRRESKAASRRRSTLNPWELASLMSGTGGTEEGEAPVVPVE